MKQTLLSSLVTFKVKTEGLKAMTVSGNKFLCNNMDFYDSFKKEKTCTVFYRIIETRVEVWRRRNAVGTRSARGECFYSFFECSQIFHEENIFSISFRKHTFLTNQRAYFLPLFSNYDLLTPFLTKGRAKIVHFQTPRSKVFHQSRY